MLADIQPRLAVDDDVDAIAILSRDLIEHGMPWGWQSARVRKCIKASDTNVVAAGPKGSPVGFGIMKYQDDEAHLLLFAVATNHQRRGIGSSLLLWLEDVARIAGARRVQVEARRENEAARCFYNEHGYHEWALERGMYRAAVDGVHLEKWLVQVSPKAGDA